jgi:hypothetical protein
MSLPDCYKLSLNCNFPTTVGEVYELVALESAASAAYSSTKLQYQNAFCSPSKVYCLDPCPPLPQDLTDECDFECVYKKYGTGCAVDCCSTSTEYNTTCTSTTSSYVNPVTAQIKSFLNFKYPDAVAAANSSSSC